MAILLKKLFYRKGGNTYAINRYDTVAEMRGKPYLCTKSSDGVVGYSPLDTTGEVSDLYIKRNGQVLRALTKAGMPPIVIDDLNYKYTILQGYTTVDYTLYASTEGGPGFESDAIVYLMHKDKLKTYMIDEIAIAGHYTDEITRSGTFNVAVNDVIEVERYCGYSDTALCSVVIT